MRTTLTGVRFARRPHHPGVLLAALAVPAVLALSACSGGSSDAGPISVTGTAGPAGASSSTPTVPASATSTSGSGSSGSGSSSGKGCTSGEQQTPRGVTTVATADLDGDGKADRIWLGDTGSKRYLGVIYSAGGGRSITFTSAAPEAATAVAGRLSSGAAIILLDTGRSVSLYSVVDCAIVATRNAQGAQYSFDKGFTGYGTGVACPTIGGAERLAGYLAKPVGSGGKAFDVTRTTIDVTDGGRRASNGTKATLGSKLSASDATVKIAQSVSCAGSGVAKEATS